MKELNSLCLEVIPTGVVEKKEEKETEEDLKKEEVLEEKAEELAQAAGAQIVQEVSQ